MFIYIYIVTIIENIHSLFIISYHIFYYSYNIFIQIIKIYYKVFIYICSTMIENNYHHRHYTCEGNRDNLLFADRVICGREVLRLHLFLRSPS